MEVVVNSSGLKLIKKYERYYLRFVGGQYEEYPCDLLITNKEAMSIIADNAIIKTVRDEYKKKIPWTLLYFVDEAIKDYMLYVCNMTEKRIAKGLEKFNRHKDIKMEFYETIMYDDFPVNSPITVEGYNAKQLNQNTHLSVIGAYNYLIYLREDAKNALEDLQKGLPQK